MTDENEGAAPATGERLGRLRPRDTSAALSHSAMYTRLVGFLRWALLLLVVGALVSLVVWPMARSRKLATTLASQVPDLVVEHLNLTGVDKNDQTYALRAERALRARDMADKNTVDLEKPNGEIALKSGAWLAGKAALGRLDQTSKRLWLGGGVELFHDQGYRFLTEEMFADLGKSVAWGTKPVLIQGSFGKIRGTGFRFLDGGKAFVVTGPVKARLDLRRTGSSVKPSGKDSSSR